MALFLVTRSGGAPAPSTPFDEVGNRIFSQWWKARQHPYHSLQSGDTLYWVDQRSREICWELRVRNVRRARCGTEAEYAGYLRHWFGVLDSDDAYGRGREGSWLLAWENELVRPVGVSLPSSQRLGRNGMLEISPEDRVSFGLPRPGRKAVLPVEEVGGPAQLFAPGARRAIPSSVRTAVFERDGRTCRHCGDSEGPFHIDHRFPFSKGGPTRIENLQVLCAKCNLSKSASVLDGGIAEQLLPESDLERLIVKSGRRRPETVADAAGDLRDLALSGEITVESAAVIAITTLHDLAWDDGAAAEFSTRFLSVEDQDWRMWGQIIDVVSLTIRNSETLEADWASFAGFLESDGVLGDVTAAVIAPHVALVQLAAIRQAPGADKLRSLMAAVTDAEYIVARGKQCSDPRLRGRTRPLEVLALDESVRAGNADLTVFNELLSAMSAGPSQTDPLAYLLAAYVFATWSEAGPGVIDAAIGCGTRAALSPWPGPAADACRVVSLLASQRNGEGDDSMATFYAHAGSQIEQHLTE